MIKIKQLKTEQELAEGFAVMKQLRTHLSEQSYINLLKDMTEQGYRQFALYDGDTMMAITGVIIQTNLYNGRHVWVDDLVTASQARSKGYGEKLLKYIEEWGREQQCERVALSSGLQREAAHRFYKEKMDYEKASYVFRKSLSQ